MKIVKKKNNISFIIGIIEIVLMTIFSFLMLKENILPLKYIFIIMIIILVLLGTFFYIGYFNKNKKIKILMIALSLVTILVPLVVFYYQDKTNNFINKITKENKFETISYSLLVLNDNSDSLKDYNNGKIGIIGVNIEANNAIEKKLINSIKFERKEYSNVATIMADLTENKLNAILLENNYVEMLEESDSDSYKKIKVIWTGLVKLDAKSIKKPVSLSIEPFTILISGIDTYGPIGNVSRSDVNMLMTVNPKTHEILLVHIPRDYYIPFSNHGMKDKLTHSGIYGIDVTVSTLENYFGIDINYYIRVNFNTLVDIVDILGGIEVDVDVAFSNWGETYTKGINHLNGKRALTFSRSRKMLAGGDRDRGRNQQKVLAAIINKASSPKIIANYSSVLEVMGKSFTTNMSSAEIKEFINFELNKLPKWNIKSISVDGYGIEPLGTPFFPNIPIYVMDPYIETVNIAIEEINKLKNKK